MHIACTSVELKSNNIGYFPVSAYITIDPKKPPTSLETFYSDIQKVGCPDLIIQGEIDEESERGLSWATVKLISEGFYISLIVNADTKIPHIVVHKHIYITNLSSIKANRGLLGAAEAKDIVLIEEVSGAKILAVKTILLNNNCKAKIMILSSTLAENEIISNNEFWTIHKYYRS
jgi:hypothetical protein